ncbi:MAG: TOBE domain-containing protein, partial [Myxococcales bacterium]
AASVGVRPEHIRISRDAGDWQGRVGVAEHLGSDTFLHVHVDGAGLQTVRTVGENSFAPGDEVWLTPDPARIYRFDGAGLALR